MSSTRVTIGKEAWWTAQLSNVAKIEKILVYLNQKALTDGCYNKFRVQMRLDEKGTWTNCKGPYQVKGSVSLHVVRCNAQNSYAKYMRISTFGKCRRNRGSWLRLLEVNVFGYVKGNYFPLEYTTPHTRLV